MENQVKVRFAPSPTGYLHIGGARTAIFNWLFAKKHNGKFILRIEDTDADRSTKDSIQGIVDGLRWLGLDWDEGPNFQSANIKNHLDAADHLIESGHAYKCFCKKETIDQQREISVARKETYAYDRTCRDLSLDQIKEKEAKGLPYAIRLKVPTGDGAVSFTDAVCGSTEKKYADLDDFIIVRSNGKPLYILSNAVDDINDGITHIIRGQDGLASTPKQILIYKALKAPLPVFAHMSLTLDPQKAKISKRRHGEMVAIHYYRQKGFLPWAFVNFLVLLGWATKESKEIFTKEELINAFSLDGISKTNSIFNIKQEDPDNDNLDNSKFFTDPKALNINSHYLRTLPEEFIAKALKPFLQDQGLWKDSFETDKKDWFLNAIALTRDRFYVLSDFTERGRAYFSEDFAIDPDALKKNLIDHPEMETCLPQLSDNLAQLDEFSEKTVESALRDFLKTNKIKPGVLINAVRVALTGQSVGPDFIKSLILLGQNRVSNRLKQSFF